MCKIVHKIISPWGKISLTSQDKVLYVSDWPGTRRLEKPLVWPTPTTSSKGQNLTLHALLISRWVRYIDVLEVTSR